MNALHQNARDRLTVTARSIAVAFSLLPAIVGYAQTDQVTTPFAGDFNYTDRHVLSVELDMRFTLLTAKQVVYLKRQTKVLFDLREIPFPLPVGKLRLENSNYTLGEFVAKFCDARLLKHQDKVWVRHISKYQIVLFRLDALPVELRDVIMEPGDCLVLAYTGGRL